jgi:hypothetical protein
MNEKPMNAEQALAVLGERIEWIEADAGEGHQDLKFREARAFFADLVKREAELAGVVVALHEAISTFSITNQGATEAGAADTVGLLLKYATRALDRRAGPQEPQA